MNTTLNDIRACSPCAEGWTKLLQHLGKTKADDELLPLVTILDSNGLEDAIWCLEVVKGQDRAIRLFGVACARQVQHLMADPRSLAALDVAERFANGEATTEELSAARSAAWSAAESAAEPAARSAARSAAWSAAWSSAEPAAWSAARAKQCELFRQFFG